MDALIVSGRVRLADRAGSSKRPGLGGAGWPTCTASRSLGLLSLSSPERAVGSSRSLCSFAVQSKPRSQAARTTRCQTTNLSIAKPPRAFNQIESVRIGFAGAAGGCGPESSGRLIRKVLTPMGA